MHATLFPPARMDCMQMQQSCSLCWPGLRRATTFSTSCCAGPWCSSEDSKASRKRAITALNDAEALPNPHIKHLYTDVFDEEPWHLQEQKAELKDHLMRYREHYADIPTEEIETL